MDAASIAALSTAIVSIIGAVASAVVAIRSKGQADSAKMKLAAHVANDHGTEVTSK